jgi:hypothetical protein
MRLKRRIMLVTAVSIANFSSEHCAIIWREEVAPINLAENRLAGSAFG